MTMRTLLTTTLLLTMFSLLAQENKSSTIKRVTVFASSAQVEREAVVALKKGEQQIVISGLSPQINAATVRVRPKNKKALVRQIVYKTEYSESAVDEKTLNALLAKIESEKRNLEIIDARKSGLLKEREFLAKNMDVNGTAGMQMSLAQFQQTESFYRAKMESIQTELYDLNVKHKAQVATINKLALELKKAGSRKTELSGLITITLDAPEAISTTLTIDYLVNNAGWTPEYELRVDEVGKPVALELKANLVQLTDVDWNKVNLAFSTGDPNRSSQAPELLPWFITQPVAKPAVYNRPPIAQTNQGYTGRFNGMVWDAQTNEPLPFANVLFYSAKGEVVGGVTTDFDGAYNYVVNDPINRIQVSSLGYQTQTVNAPANGQMNVRLNPTREELAEVVIVSDDIEIRGSRSASQPVMIDGVKIQNMPMRDIRAQKERKAKVTAYNATQVRKAITQVFEAKAPYTVKSDGKEMAITLQEYELPVDYSYVAVPKLDDDAFLKALLFGWDTLGLISGNIKVFIEGSFVGNSTLDVNAIDDSLSFSLGRDPNVVVKRVNVPTEYRKSLFGGKRIKTIAYRIEIRNNKNVPIHIQLQDQFPLSPNDDIVIKQVETSGGTVDGETGIVTWEIDLKPGEQTARSLQFEVTYPKGVTVYF
jgi:hypothetical protein